MRSNLRIGLWVACGLLLAGMLSACSASRKTIQYQGTQYAQLSKRQFVELYGQKSDYPAVSARGRLAFKLEGAGRDLNLQGIGLRWHQERGRGYQLSVRPWSFMEVGQLTVADDTLYVVDRFHKYYYLQPGARRELNRVFPIVGLDAKMLIHLIENRPFSFVESGVDALRRMTMNRTEEGYTFTHQLRPGGNRIELFFDPALNLCTTTIALPGEGVLRVTYDQFVALSSDAEKRAQPTTIEIELRGEGTEAPIYALLYFSLEQMQETSPRDWHISPPNGYRSVTLDGLIKILKELSRL